MPSDKFVAPCPRLRLGHATLRGRDAGPDFARFLQMAMGSASELEYHVLLARDLNLPSNDVHHRLAEDTTEVKRMLTSLIRKVRGAKTAHS